MTSLRWTSLRWSRVFRQPVLSVVVPTYNRARELGLCLEGFAEQTALREQFEVSIVDDGSAQNMATVCETFQDRLLLNFVRQENSGPSVARNAGIGRARAPLLLLYDDDLRPFADIVERCLAFYRLFPDERDISLLYFSPDPDFAGEPFIRWTFRLIIPFPHDLACSLGDTFGVALVARPSDTYSRWGASLWCGR